MRMHTVGLTTFLALSACSEWTDPKEFIELGEKVDDTAKPDTADADTDADSDADSDTDADTDTDTSVGPVDADGDGYAEADDCNDTDASVHPGAAELCNGVDENCDGAVDEGISSTWYADADGDGYGDASLSLDSCEQPVGYVADATDCDAANAAIHPGAVENDCADPTDYNCDGSTGYADADGDLVIACEDCDDADAARSPLLTEVCDADDVDEDCDGLEDDKDPEGADGATTWYTDADLDAFGLDGTAVALCDAGIGYAAVAGDCDDANIAANPAEMETCSTSFDDDCDGDTEDGPDTSYWHPDDDLDGYGDQDEYLVSCTAPAGWVIGDGDCDDGDAAVNPAATETCDGVDEDCDGVIDNGLGTLATWYADADGDGYGDGALSVDACAAPVGYVLVSDADGDGVDDWDCDDTDAAFYPGAAESLYTVWSEACGAAYDGQTVTTSDGPVALVGESLVAEADGTFADGTTGSWERISSYLGLSITDAVVADAVWEHTLVGTYKALYYDTTSGLGEVTDECFFIPELGDETGDPLLEAEGVVIMIDVDNASVAVPSFSAFLGDAAGSPDDWLQASSAVSPGSETDAQWVGKVAEAPYDMPDLIVCTRHSFAITHVAVVRY